MKSHLLFRAVADMDPDGNVVVVAVENDQGG